MPEHRRPARAVVSGWTCSAGEDPAPCPGSAPTEGLTSSCSPHTDHVPSWRGSLRRTRLNWLHPPGRPSHWSRHCPRGAPALMAPPREAPPPCWLRPQGSDPTFNWRDPSPDRPKGGRSARFRSTPRVAPPPKPDSTAAGRAGPGLHPQVLTPPKGRVSAPGFDFFPAADARPSSDSAPRADANPKVLIRRSASPLESRPRSRHRHLPATPGPAP